MTPLRRAAIVRLLLLMTVCAPTRSEAQLAANRRSGLSNTTESARTISQPAFQNLSSESYWLTGFVAGSVVGAVVVAALVSSGETTASLSAKDVLFVIGIGPLIGGVPGAFIGSLFKKETRALPVQ